MPGSAQLVANRWKRTEGRGGTNRLGVLGGIGRSPQKAPSLGTGQPIRGGPEQGLSTGNAWWGSVGADGLPLRRHQHSAGSRHVLPRRCTVSGAWAEASRGVRTTPWWNAYLLADRIASDAGPDRPTFSAMSFGLLHLVRNGRFTSVGVYQWRCVRWISGMCVWRRWPCLSALKRESSRRKTPRSLASRLARATGEKRLI
jgi:hypothetical protein